MAESVLHVENVTMQFGGVVAVTPSARQAGVYDIAPFTLQNIISSHISDLKILSVESPVEIEFPQQEHD